jgi:aspartyl-tRNA(Asn)/glutamyl-tRNA(Gln) amidotransferase subunit C
VISDADVEHVARLARLALTEGERSRMREQLDGILAYIDTLRALDTSAIEPTSHAVPLVNVMRDDEVRPCLAQDVALANAPERSGEFFRVPKIIEEGPGEPSQGSPS